MPDAAPGPSQSLTFPVLSVTLGAFLIGAPAAEAKTVSAGERQALIRQGRVWNAIDPATLDLLNGPQGEGSYKAGEKVACTFEERDPAKPIGGHSKKFPCHDAAGSRLKIKYDPAVNREVFGEVAGTRLFWALGFYAERMYSVKVACANCSKDPFLSDKPPRATRVFEPATIQKRLKGVEILAGDPTAENEGWTFDELELVDASKGGASKAELDALKLLAVFVNHGDNTPNQQRILCAEDDPACARPILYATDLGGAFGGSDFFTSFKGWSKKARLWKDPKACVADFRGTVEGFQDPAISEAGRKLLADQLAKLSDRQVRDLFQGARFDLLGRLEPPSRMPDGKVRAPRVEDWVRVFKDKREQILSATCPD